MVKKKRKTVICPDCGQEYEVFEEEYNLMAILGDSWLISQCPNSNEHYLIRLRKKVSAVPKGTKQKILDLLFHNGLTVGEVREKVDLELDVVAQIIVDDVEGLLS